MKIGTKLIVIITAVNLICIGGLTICSLMFTSGQISYMAKNNAATITENTSNQLKAWMEVSLDEIRALSQIISNFDQLRTEDRRHILNLMLYSIAKENVSFVGAWAAFEPDALDGMDKTFINTEGTDSSGRYISYFSRDLEGNLQVSPLVDYDDPGKAGAFYHTSFNSGLEAVIDPYYYGINGKDVLITSLTIPIFRGSKVIGVAGVDLELSDIQEIVSKIRPFGDGVSAIFSNGGIIVAHPDSSRLGKNLEETEADMVGKELGSLVNAIKTGNPFQTVIRSADNMSMIFDINPFNIGRTDTPWAAAILVPERTIMAPVYRMTAILVVLGSIILAIVTIIVMLIARTITAPLKSMEEVFITVGEGDFTPVLPAQSKDEIGNISRSFNNTLEKIRILISTIKEQSASLFDIGTNLASNMDQTSAAVTEINANIQSIKNQVLNQSASVTQTNATMEQISSHIDKLSLHVGDQSNSVSESSNAIEEMLANIKSVTLTLVKNTENVDKLIEASDVGHSSLKDAVVDIEEIARESEGLFEINAVMENIASQTNLLSMNAAIEAAHAGEAGKGFAVVADEIRKLAEGSEEQSKIIATVLKKIKTSIDKINFSTLNVLDKFDAIDKEIKTVVEQEGNIRNAMEEQGAGSKQILDAVSRLNDITYQVRNEAEEMSDGSKEVINESKNLENVTANITNGMSEMASGANQINSAVIQVREITEKNKQSIDTLVKAVSRFKVA
ncbi:MAG: methyl-accepting chemotaxis protein [Treponema sp.]|nr:methyl-accepting chemotaxis protein [Treponema sp.]